MEREGVKDRRELVVLVDPAVVLEAARLIADALRAGLHEVAQALIVPDAPE